MLITIISWPIALTFHSVFADSIPEAQRNHTLQTGQGCGYLIIHGNRRQEDIPHEILGDGRGCLRIDAEMYQGDYGSLVFQIAP